MNTLSTIDKLYYGAFDQTNQISSNCTRNGMNVFLLNYYDCQWNYYKYVIGIILIEGLPMKLLLTEQSTGSSSIC